VLVAHTGIPSYSRGRDQEDHNLKPSLAKQFARPYLKKIHHKKVFVEWLKVYTLSSNLSTTKKKEYK
jgi:hypothetical protein